MQSHPLTNFEIQKYENEPKFNGVYSRNLTKIKKGRYAINLDKFKSIGTHWITLYIDNYDINYFDSFGVEHILKEMKKFMGNKNIANIYRIKPNGSIVWMHLYWIY